MAPVAEWVSFWKGDAEFAAQSIACRHNRRANVMFVDGHIEAMTKRELISRDVTGVNRVGGIWCRFTRRTS